MRSARRVANDVAARLTSTAPTVTLTRIQSGTGALDGQVVAPPGVGRLSLGCVVQLDNGATYAVHCIGGQATAPPDEVNPVVRLHPDSITFDLRRVTALRRSLVYAVIEASDFAWSGSLLFTTYGGASVEVPFEAQPATTIALTSLHNIRGELVLRAEADLQPDPPTAWRAFGYEVGKV